MNWPSIQGVVLPSAQDTGIGFSIPFIGQAVYDNNNPCFYCFYYSIGYLIAYLLAWHIPCF